MRSFLANFPKMKPFQLLFAMLSLVSAIAIVLQGYSFVQIVDSVFIQKLKFNATLPYFGVLLVAFTLRLLMNYFLHRTGTILAMQAKNTIREQLLEKWQLFSVETMKQTQAGHKISLYVETVDELDGYFREYLPQKMKSQIVPIVLLIAVVFAHPTSALILLITAPFIPLSYIIIGVQTKHKAEKQLDAMNRFSGKFLDLLHGLQTVQLFSQTTRQRSILQQYNAQFTNTTLSVLKIAFAATLFIELITTLGVGLIALEIGFQMIVFQTLAFAPAFFVLTLAPEFYNALKELGAAFHTGKGSSAAMQLLDEELTKQVFPVHFGEEPVDDFLQLALHKAVFEYESGTQIGPLSITIPKNKTIALIGPTGHGKTTALNMLASMVELTDGTLTINGLNRQQIAEQSWYEHMIFITQHPFVFAGTIRSNLLLGKNMPDEQIVASLQRAQLTEWLSQLPDGLDTVIGEGGRGVSGGEKQRIAITRPLISEPRIVFFDEPTAGLDVLTEQMMSRTMKQLATKATIVLVTHRYETLKQADFIYCIENGRLRASGTHETLQEDPFYVAMRNGGSTNAGAV